MSLFRELAMIRSLWILIVTYPSSVAALGQDGQIILCVFVPLVVIVIAAIIARVCWEWRRMGHEEPFYFDGSYRRSTEPAAEISLEAPRYSGTYFFDNATRHSRKESVFSIDSIRKDEDDLRLSFMTPLELNIPEQTRQPSDNGCSCCSENNLSQPKDFDSINSDSSFVIRDERKTCPRPLERHSTGENALQWKHTTKMKSYLKRKRLNRGEVKTHRGKNMRSERIYRPRNMAGKQERMRQQQRHDRRYSQISRGSQNHLTKHRAEIPERKMNKMIGQQNMTTKTLALKSLRSKQGKSCTIKRRSSSKLNLEKIPRKSCLKTRRIKRTPSLHVRFRFDGSQQRRLRKLAKTRNQAATSRPRRKGQFGKVSNYTKTSRLNDDEMRMAASASFSDRFAGGENIRSSFHRLESPRTNTFKARKLSQASHRDSRLLYFPLLNVTSQLQMAYQGHNMNAASCKNASIRQVTGYDQHLQQKHLDNLSHELQPPHHRQHHNHHQQHHKQQHCKQFSVSSLPTGIHYVVAPNCTKESMKFNNSVRTDHRNSGPDSFGWADPLVLKRPEGESSSSGSEKDSLPSSFVFCTQQSSFMLPSRFDFQGDDGYLRQC